MTSGLLEGMDVALFLAGGVNVQSLEVGDLTGDGRDDIVVVSRADATARVYRNNGEAGFSSFTQIASLAAPATAIGVTLADLGGSGSPPSSRPAGPLWVRKHCWRTSRGCLVTWTR